MKNYFRNDSMPRISEMILKFEPPNLMIFKDLNKDIAEFYALQTNSFQIAPIPVNSML